MTEASMAQDAGNTDVFEDESLVFAQPESDDQEVANDEPHKASEIDAEQDSVEEPALVVEQKEEPKPRLSGQQRRELKKDREIEYLKSQLALKAESEGVDSQEQLVESLKRQARLEVEQELERKYLIKKYPDFLQVEEVGSKIYLDNAAIDEINKSDMAQELKYFLAKDTAGAVKLNGLSPKKLAEEISKWEDFVDQQSSQPKPTASKASIVSRATPPLTRLKSLPSSSNGNADIDDLIENWY